MHVHILFLGYVFPPPLECYIKFAIKIADNYVSKPRFFHLYLLYTDSITLICVSSCYISPLWKCVISSCPFDVLSCYRWRVCFVRLRWFCVALFHFIYEIRFSYLSCCLNTNSMFFLSAAVFKLCSKDTCTSRCSWVCENYGGGGGALSASKRPTWSAKQMIMHGGIWWYWLCHYFYFICLLSTVLFYIHKQTGCILCWCKSYSYHCYIHI
jgi:hypothetical protein